MPKDFFNRQSHVNLLLILGVISYFFLMSGNGRLSLTHPDEVFYIQTAKEMLARNSWLTPRIFDHPQFEKPILTFALFSIAIKGFGLTAFAARFWPAVFGILGVLTTYWIAWMLFKQKRLSFLAGLILATSFIYIALSRAVLTDMIFSILVVISVGFFYMGVQDQGPGALGIIGGFVFSALAVLTKGLLGYTFPLTIITVYLLLRGDRGLWQNKAAIGGMFLFIVIAVPWHIYMVNHYGQAFIDEYWWNDHVRRIVDAEHQKSNTWYFYLLTMIGGVMPWSLFLVPASILAVKQIRQKLQDAPQIMFLFCWIVITYCYVQVAQSKLASYIFPVFPAIAIVLAYYGHKALDSRDVFPRNSLRFISLVTGIILTAAIAASLYFSQKYAQFIPNKIPLYVFIVLVALIVSALSYFIRRRDDGRMFFTFPCITATVLIIMLLGIPYAEPWVSCKMVSDALNKIDQSQSTVLTSKFYVRGVRFFTDRSMAVIDINGSGFFSPHPIPFLNKDEMVLEFLKSQPVTFSVLKESNVDDLKRIIQKGSFRLEELYNEGGKQIIKIERF